MNVFHQIEQPNLVAFKVWLNSRAYLLKLCLKRQNLLIFFHFYFLIGLNYDKRFRICKSSDKNRKTICNLSLWNLIMKLVKSSFLFNNFIEIDITFWITKNLLWIFNFFRSKCMILLLIKFVDVLFTEWML